MRIINVKRGQIQSTEKRKHQYNPGSKDSLKKNKSTTSQFPEKEKHTAYKKNKRLQKRSNHKVLKLKT